MKLVDVEDVAARATATSSSVSQMNQPRKRLMPGLSKEQLDAPYAQALERFSASEPLSLMVPGHGGDVEAGAGHLKMFGTELPRLDVPLMIQGVDLGEDSPLPQARRLAAQAWGARRTWFMTNGASQANRTAALAVRGLGERVVMQRSSHSSFTDGILLAGLIPAFVSPRIDLRNGIAHGLTPDALSEVLQHEMDAGRPATSVYVVSPSYFGSTADVAGLARVAHQYDAALIVDGAWGAHFGFHPDLPEAPSRLGADLVVSSTHKLAGSLTQSAMLHLGEGPYAERLEPLVERAFAMTASTSASAVLMASLDLARRELATGVERIERAIGLANELREQVRHDPYLSLGDEGFNTFPDVIAQDPLHVVIDVSACGVTGHWVRERLAHEHGIYFEMATVTSVVVVVGAFRDFHPQRVSAALSSVVEAAIGEGGGQTQVNEFPELPEHGTLSMLPRDAFFGDSELIPAAQAVGRISSDTLAAYPPGIPNLIPGERVSEQTVAFLQAVAASPTGYVRGAADAGVSMMRVVLHR